MRRVSLALLVLLAAACTDRSAPPAPDNGTPAPRVTSALTWSTLAPALSERTEVAAAAVGTRIYVIGGYREDGGTVSTVEILDTATGRWERGPDLPVAVNHAMAAAVGGTVYLFGGFQEGGDASAAAYRLDGGVWRPVAAMPQPRGAGTAISVEGQIYVAGGVNAGGLSRQMLVYDVAADRWSAAPGPPTPREHLGGAGFGGLVYTVGGRAGGQGNFTAFEVYDPGTGQWRKLPDLPTRRGGLAAAATCSGRIVAVGGEADATFEEAEVYDVRAGTWQALPPLPTPRHGLGVVAIGTSIYTLSGGPRPGLHVANTTEAIDLADLGAC
ncbi:Kelch repeat-containing protein [Micromonospora sp. CPCC 206061]|uniref:Kelch repeat-containing protein n=1 Tax=Micromonospora sp. CPCC 206061 TaxID=3122410 RepID=UPI002FEEC645